MRISVSGPHPYWHFEAAAQVDEFQLFEMGTISNRMSMPFTNTIHILDLAAGMDMQVGDMKLVFFNKGQYFIYLIDGYTEFAFVMTGRDFEIAAGHDIGTQADSYRVGMSECLTEFLQVGQAVDIDENAKIAWLPDFFEIDAVGGIEDPVRGKAGVQGQFHFID